MSQADERESLGALRALHDEVDGRARDLAAHHGERLKCGKGCFDCCIDGLTVLEVEADRIRAGHGELLATGRPHPAGACAFLDGDGACRVYADRPYVCRTQGLPLLWFEELEDDDVVQRRGICELNLEGPPLDDLDVDVVWAIGPIELRLARLQERHGTPGERVPLRDLFAAADPQADRGES